MSRDVVTIVLPTRNGMPLLEKVLDGIAAQKADVEIEVVAIDSGSADGTLECLRDRGHRLLTVEPAAFNHGATRNQGIAAARGEFVVLLSQDAEPASPGWLAALIEPLRNNPHIAGTYARQQPRPTAGAITRHYHAAWSGSSLQPRVMRIDDRATYYRMAPLEKMAACAFDNVCSCIRKDVWERHPFPATPIAEDLEWSRTVLLAGHTLAYVPDSVVLHSHERSAAYEFRRTALLHHRLHALFGVRTVPSTFELVRAVAATARMHQRCRRQASPDSPFEGFSRAMALAVAWPLGQYVGGWRASHGLPPIGGTGV